MESDNHTQLETVSVGVGRDDNTTSMMEINSSSQLCNVSSSSSESPCSGSCNSICRRNKGEQCGVTLGDTDSSVKKKGRKRKDKVKADGPLYSDIIRCHICGDKASGMHYGVYSCEGCKGFFRRTQRLEIDYKPCPYWGQQDGCIINIGSRNKCQYCRYQKCLTLGMSSGAIRMGRVPKVEVQKLKYELDQKDNVSKESDERRRCRLFVDALADQFHRIVITIKEEDREKFWKRCSTPFKSYMPNGTCVVNGMQLDLEGPPREITNRAEMARQCFTNMEITIEKYATFAKQREMFRRLSAQDQLTLFKGAALEVCAALSSGRYYHGIYRFPEINTYIRRDVAENSPFGESSTYKPEMMFYEMFNELGMTNKEIAVYCTFLLYTPDREGLVDRELVEAHQEKLAQMLYDQLKRDHPDRHNLFSKLMDVTVSLRSLVPDHLERLKQIKMRCHGHLPTDISPLLGEVYGNRVMQAEDGHE